MKTSGTSETIRATRPLLGEHTEHVIIPDIHSLLTDIDSDEFALVQIPFKAFDRDWALIVEYRDGVVISLNTMHENTIAEYSFRIQSANLPGKYRNSEDGCVVHVNQSDWLDEIIPEEFMGDRSEIQITIFIKLYSPSIRNEVLQEFIDIPDLDVTESGSRLQDLAVELAQVVKHDCPARFHVRNLVYFILTLL